MRHVLLFVWPIFAFSLLVTPGWAVDFPGGALPPERPALFAPGLVNTGLLTRDLTMTPDGREVYFCQATAGYGHAVILVTRRLGDGWTPPEVAPFSGDPRWTDLEPCVAPDGASLFFYSSRPAAPDGLPAQDLWVMDRQGDRWGEPRNLGAPVNTDAPEFFPSVAADGTLYFCRADPQTRVHTLYRARRQDGRYLEPEVLPAAANAGRNRFNAWIAPDQSRLIVPVAGQPGNHGPVDYWLAVRDPQDNWTGPFNLGPVVNDGAGGAWSPSVSPDGRAFFFMSARAATGANPWPESWSGLQARHNRPGGGRSAIFWMDAAFLDRVAAGGPAEAVADSAVTDGAVAEATGRPWPRLTGSYLGQDPPGREPEIFAPGVVSTGLNERDIIISGDGATIWFGVMDLQLVTVLETRLVDGIWSEPVTAGFHADPARACFEPTLAADGNTLLFLGNTAAPGQEQGRGWANQNIFRSRRGPRGWSPPAALPPPVTSEAAEYFPSLAADGTLYFSREDGEGRPFLWSAEPAGDGFLPPERLPGEVNIGSSCYNAFVAPDESFLIACVGGHPDNLGPADYWISFRSPTGQWRAAVNLGEPFNGPEQRAASAFVSPDGAYLFFSANRPREPEGPRLTRAEMQRLHDGPRGGSSDIWWVRAEVLEKWRSQAN